jgi:hypothetical protein
MSYLGKALKFNAYADENDDDTRSQPRTQSNKSQNGGKSRRKQKGGVGLYQSCKTSEGEYLPCDAGLRCDTAAGDVCTKPPSGRWGGKHNGGGANYMEPCDTDSSYACFDEDNECREASDGVARCLNKQGGAKSRKHKGGCDTQNDQCAEGYVCTSFDGTRKGSCEPAQDGGKAHKKHNGRSYVVRTGSRGGKYILVKGKKVYV